MTYFEIKSSNLGRIISFQQGAGRQIKYLRLTNEAAELPREHYYTTPLWPVIGAAQIHHPVV